MVEIQGKRVLITGASSGIGKALAFEFARKGAILILVARRIDRLQKVTQDIQRTFPQLPAPAAIRCDVSDRESVSSLIHDCLDRYGGIDIMVNNAGTGIYGDTDKTSVSDFHSVLDVNFFGAVHCILEILPYMKRRGKGLVVNIASVAAKHGVPYLGAYSASKAALAAMSQSLRAELAGSGVSVMVAYPGYTQTDFFATEKLVGGGRRPDGPYASPGKVAKAIIRSIERDKKELVLSLEGKALTWAQGLLPGLVEKAMDRIAFKLRDKKEDSSGKTKITDYRPFSKSG